MNELNTLEVGGKAFRIMEKPLLAAFRIEWDGERVNPTAHGREADLEDMLVEGMTEMIEQRPMMRRVLRRAMRRVWVNTRHELLSYWLDGWPITLAGCGILFVLMYGGAALLHWIGGAI